MYGMIALAMAIWGLEHPEPEKPEKPGKKKPRLWPGDDEDEGPERRHVT